MVSIAKLRHGIIAPCVIIALLSSATAQADEAAARKQAGLSTWHEAVITTRDPQPWLDLFIEFANWEILAEQNIDKVLLAQWGLNENASGRSIVIANPGSTRGYIRLMHLDGVEQDWIRADDRPWDTGGLFDINVRIKDIATHHKKLLDLGWQGDSIPQTLLFGPWEVIEWIARGPDGVRFAFIERIKPALEGWDFEVLSRTFNSTQTVVDMEKSLAFFRDGLGMQVKVEHKAASKEPGPNVLGLSHEGTAAVAREVYVLNGADATEGQIELLKFHGASGRDLSAQTHPANIGLSIIRYQVDKLADITQTLTSRGVELLHEPLNIQLPPYGQVQLTAFQAPEGARFELFEVLNDSD